MKPTSTWIDEWRCGLDPSRENAIASELLKVFRAFWDQQKLDDKSKTTRNRYAGALHALGGYLVDRAVREDGLDKTADDLLFEHVTPLEGPLVHHDNEAWQDELDMVCRKLYKHMEKHVTRDPSREGTNGF